MGLSIGLITTYQFAPLRARAREGEMEGAERDRQTGQARQFTIFHNQILKVTFHHFCHFILLARSKSLVWPRLMGKGLHNSVNTRKWGPFGTILEAANSRE